MDEEKDPVENDDQKLLFEFQDACKAALVDARFLHNLLMFLQSAATLSPDCQAGSITVLLQQFVSSNKVMVNAKMLQPVMKVVAGSTAAGKDKLVAGIVGLAVANSSAGITTRLAELLTIMRDISITDPSFTITTPAETFTFDTLVKMLQARAQIQADTQGFPDDLLQIDIRSPEPSTRNVVICNLPGLVSIGTEEGQKLFKAQNKRLNQIAKEKGTIFITRKVGDVMANEIWTSFDFVTLKQNVDVVVVVTHGDHLPVPSDLSSYEDAENRIFGQIRAVVPHATCFLVASSNLDGIHQHEIGVQEAETTFCERLELTFKKIAANLGPGTDMVKLAEERRKFEAKCGMENLRLRYWSSELQQVARPLKTLTRGLYEGQAAMLAHLEKELASLEAWTDSDWAGLLEKFCSDFYEALPGVTIGAGSASCDVGFLDACAHSMLTAEEEHEKIVIANPFKGKNNLYTQHWQAVISAPTAAEAQAAAAIEQQQAAYDEDGDAEDEAEADYEDPLQRHKLNQTGQFLLHRKLERFWNNLHAMMSNFTMSQQDMAILSASLSADEVGLVSRLRPCFKHLKAQIVTMLTFLADFVPWYITGLCHQTVLTVKSFLRTNEPLCSVLRMREDVNRSLDEVMRKVYIDDMATMLRKEIMDHVARVKKTKVNLDIHGALERISGHAADYCGVAKSQRVLAPIEWSGGLDKILTQTGFDTLTRELGKTFNVMINMHLDPIKHTIAESVLSEFGFSYQTSNHSKVLFKHVLCGLPGFSQREAVELIIKNAALTQTGRVPGEVTDAAFRANSGNLLGFYASKGRVHPPQVAHLSVVTALSLEGLVHAYDVNEPFVLTTSYFTPLARNAVTTLIDYIVKLLRDTGGVKRARLAACEVMHEKVELFQTVLEAANDYFIKTLPSQLDIPSNGLVHLAQRSKEVANLIQFVKDGLPPNV